MSPPRDLLGKIAQARASLMMRGIDRMVLHIGAGEYMALGHDVAAVEDWPEVVEIKVSTTASGWIVEAA